MEITSSLPDQKLISQLEAEGAGRFERERTPVAAGDVGFRLYQGGCIKGFGRPRPRANGGTEQNQQDKQDG